MNMKKSLIIIFVFCFVLNLLLIGCNRAQQLAVPDNLNIYVTGRLMTVTWDPVANASGYIIRSGSMGCLSANRIVNTVTRTATTHAGDAIDSSVAEHGITDKESGFVTFTGETSFTIWLMPEVDSETEVMAASLGAYIIAVGDRRNYSDSERSASAIINKADYE